MSVRKVKDAAKIFISNEAQIQAKVIKTLNQISQIVGRTLGPAGRIIAIESDYPGIPNKMTKDGVTVFNSLSANDPFEQIIIEQTRAAAGRTASEAGDGTTTATILAANLTKSLLEFCNTHRSYSPQKVVRILNKVLTKELLPFIKKASIKVDADNLELLRLVAKISANGDEDMANAVITAFEAVGYGENSHVTIQEASGPGGFDIELIEGFPIQMGYEDSIGKFHTQFINDQANIRSVVDKPLFLLYDGIVSDLLAFQGIFEALGTEYQNGNSDTCNIVFVAHGFSETVLHTLGMNFIHPTTMNVIPLVTPMTAVVNSRLNFLYDVAAFTGAKVFGLNNNVREAQPSDFGKSMTRFECYRFRSTIVGTPDAMDIEMRAEILKKQAEAPESIQAKIDLTERLGKLTTGIAKITIFADSSGELKEKHDRVEDAVCAVRATIIDGALPGGCRVLTNLTKMVLALKGTKQEKEVYNNVLAPSLLSPLDKLLENAGYNEEEKGKIMDKLFSSDDLIYDVENQKYGTAEKLGVFDASKAVQEAVKNAISIASTMGVLGGIIAYPRDAILERDEASKDADWRQATENPTSFTNEANERV